MFLTLWLMFIGFLNSVPFLLSYVSSRSNTFPKPLSSKEEAEYLALCRQGDENARNKLIEHNLRLVAHIAKKYTPSSSTDNEDLISIGTIGLIKAITTYNDSKSNRLAAYAARCIENEILMFMRSSKKLQQEVSLNECLGHDSDGNEITFMDILTDDEDVAEKADLNMDIRKLYRYIEKDLTEREKEILKLRYGLGGKRITQRKIAQNLDISRSYVSRIEKKAIKKLAERFKNE